MTVYLSEDTDARLQAWCEMEHRQASASIDDAINAWLDRFATAGRNNG